MLRHIADAQQRGYFRDLGAEPIGIGESSEIPDNDFEWNKKLLLGWCEIYGEILRWIYRDVSDRQLDDFIRKETLEDFGRRFFKNPLTSQFCDAVVVGNDIVMIGEDGKVRVFDLGEIDGEVMITPEELDQVKGILFENWTIDNPIQDYLLALERIPDSEILKRYLLSTIDFHIKNTTGENIKKLTGREGVCSVKVNAPFEFKMGDTPAPDPTVLRVYAFDRLQEMLREEN